MGTIAARQASEVLENVRMVIAIELLAAYQGLKFREPLLPGTPIRCAIQLIEAAGLSRYGADRVLYPDLMAARVLLDDPGLLKCAGVWEPEKEPTEESGESDEG